MTTIFSRATLDKWIAGAGDYKNDAVYQKLAENIGGSEEDVLGDYVTAKWLNQNCPQYQQIIQESVDALRAEITANKDALLANM